MADEAKEYFKARHSKLSQIQALACKCCHGNRTVRVDKQRVAKMNGSRGERAPRSPVGTLSREKESPQKPQPRRGRKGPALVHISSQVELGLMGASQI